MSISGSYLYCLVCSDVMDPERCSDDELQDGVHSQCETSEVDSRDNGHELDCECPQCPPGTIPEWGQRFAELFRDDPV